MTVPVISLCRCATEEVGEEDDIPVAEITALFEALSYAHLLEDAGVMSALVKTLLHLHQWCVHMAAADWQSPGCRLHCCMSCAAASVPSFSPCSAECLLGFEAAGERLSLTRHSAVP